MISIREEIRAVETGAVPKDNNMLKHAPHTTSVVMAEKWDRPYSREVGAYPAPWVKGNKFWPTASRVDNVHGDRHLVLKLPSVGTQEPEPEAMAA
jgi:glycine dehydrogenase